MKAYVITCNDSIEFVVLNNEYMANQKKDELCMNYYNKNRYSFEDYKAYRLRYLWDVRKIPCE